MAAEGVAAEKGGMKCHVCRWLGVVVSLSAHLIIISFWWHQNSAIGLSSTFRYPDRAGYLDVRLIRELPQAIAPANGEAPIGQVRQREEASVANLHSHVVDNFTTTPTTLIFYSPQEVDKGALPYSAPDPELLTGLVVSGVPIRLRLYIDASGLVTGVEQLQALPDDQEAVNRIDKMLRGTTFMPARLGGVDVNSYQDLEFNIGPELNKISAPQ